MKSALGHPTSTSSAGTLELWRYDLVSDDSSKTYPYRVLLENGLVKSVDAVQLKASDKELCMKRKKSDQTLPFPFPAGSNGAPEIKVQPCGE